MLKETRRHPRRGDFRPHPVPGQDHHRRWAGERPAGARGHEADRPLAGGAGRRHAALSAGAAEREGRRAALDPAGIPRVQQAVARIETALAGEGRVVLRASGTEPVIRVMVEGRDEQVTRAARGRACRGRAAVAGSAELLDRAALRGVPPSIGNRANAMHARLVVGNWKMHGSRAENARLIEELIARFRARRRADCVVCPPFVYLQEVARLLRGSAIQLGAQNVCADAQGAFTGEVSAAMLKDVGCSYVIVGHSERRLLYRESEQTGGAQVRGGAIARA